MVGSPNGSISAFCHVFCITSNRIELQTWDWSSFEDICEKSMHNCNAESYATKCPVNATS